VEGTEQQAGRDDALRVGPAQQCHRDRVEADAGVDVSGELAVGAEDLADAGQTRSLKRRLGVSDDDLHRVVAKVGNSIAGS
jgi:hypothetical protein